MKKITFLIVTVLFTCHHYTSAQFFAGLGIKGGITFSNQVEKYPDGSTINNNYIHGFNASFFAECLKNNLINLYAETGYDQRGYSFTVEKYPGLITPAGEYKYTTHYIFLTLGAKLKYTGKYFTPYALLQPRLNLYLDYTRQVPAGVTEVNYRLDQFKTFVFDVGIGTGIEFNRLLPFKVFAEGNYFPAIITAYSRDYSDVKEHSFNFKLGINFIKDKKKPK